MKYLDIYDGFQREKQIENAIRIRVRIYNCNLIHESMLETAHLLQRENRKSSLEFDRQSTTR